MKAPVRRIFIFCSTVITEGKIAHRGFRAIVGNVLNDRETWSTIGAVDKRIAKAPVGRIKQFSETIITSRNIGRKWHKPMPCDHAGDDAKVVVVRRFKVVILERFDPRKCWWSSL